MDSMETTTAAPATEPTPAPTQTPIPAQTPTTSQTLPSLIASTPSHALPSSVPSTPDIPQNSLQNSQQQPQQQLQQQSKQPQQQQQQQQSSFQQSQPRVPLTRSRAQQQSHFSHFSSHLPPTSPSLSSSSTPSSSAPFSSVPPSIPASTLQRGVLALGVPARPQQPPQQSPPFSSFGPSPFNHGFGSLARSSVNMNEQMANSNTQGRPPIQGIQNMGMMGALGSGSQMRPSGVTGHHPQRPVQPQLRSQSPSSNQSLATQKFPGHGLTRVPSMSTPSSASPSTPPGSLSHPQPWMSSAQGKQMHPSSMPSPLYRSHVRTQTLQPRPQHPQHQHSMPAASHLQQLPAAKQQHQLAQSHLSQEHYGQQFPPPRAQQSLQHQQQPMRAPASVSQRPIALGTTQPGIAHSGPISLMGGTDAAETGNNILSKRTIHELVSQIDPSERLDPEVEDVLVEIAEDFVESITTIACSLAKHRKSTTLEAKDILLHLERNWNMTLPGFSGDEIKTCKKLFTNDIHKERLAAIKKSIVGTDAGNTKGPAGQTAGNAKGHVAKLPVIGSPKPRE